MYVCMHESMYLWVFILTDKENAWVTMDHLWLQVHTVTLWLDAPAPFTRNYTLYSCTPICNSSFTVLNFSSCRFSKHFYHRVNLSNIVCGKVGREKMCKNNNSRKWHRWSKAIAVRVQYLYQTNLKSSHQASDYCSGIVLCQHLSLT